MIARKILSSDVMKMWQSMPTVVAVRSSDAGQHPTPASSSGGISVPVLSGVKSISGVTGGNLHHNIELRFIGPVFRAIRKLDIFSPQISRIIPPHLLATVFVSPIEDTVMELSMTGSDSGDTQPYPQCDSGASEGAKEQCLARRNLSDMC